MRALPSGGQGLWIGAKIVDDAAWTKVAEGVYRGLSIGGEKLHKSGCEIDQIRIVEISLVDLTEGNQPPFSSALSRSSRSVMEVVSN
jgi:hypothetical protein